MIIAALSFVCCIGVFVFLSLKEKEKQREHEERARENRELLNIIYDARSKTVDNRPALYNENGEQYICLTPISGGHSRFVLKGSGFRKQ